MQIFVPKESKPSEGRVAIVPAQVAQLVKDGHAVVIESTAGVKSGFTDKAYKEAGAKLVSEPLAAINKADLIIKVKEPTLDEVSAMQADAIFFGYLHLAALPALTKAILKQGMTALGYETLRLPDGRLPLLAPMSEIAGKLAAQNGAWFLRADQGGRGVLIGGAAGAQAAKVVVLGGGVVGSNAASVAVGMGGSVTILERDSKRRKTLSEQFGRQLKVLPATEELIQKNVRTCDILIGAVLVAGAKAPQLVSENLVKQMSKGSVIVDVAVDQGGCIETTRVTTHAQPVFLKHGVLHYGVANMPGAVPVTATQSLTFASFPYIRRLAKLGLAGCLKAFPEMQSAINCSKGQIIHPALAAEFLAG